MRKQQQSNDALRETAWPGTRPSRLTADTTVGSQRRWRKNASIAACPLDDLARSLCCHPSNRIPKTAKMPTRSWVMPMSTTNTDSRCSMPKRRVVCVALDHPSIRGARKLYPDTCCRGRVNLDGCGCSRCINDVTASSSRAGNRARLDPVERCRSRWLGRT